MIYDIVNPSDDVTLETDDLDVARAVCIFLGGGKYGLNDEDGNEVMPLLFLGGFDEFCEATGFDYPSTVRNRRAKFIACLRSAMCCRVSERKAIRAAVGDDQNALARYNDEKRSSVNDICGYAHGVARQLEQKDVATATADSGSRESTQEVEA